MYNLYIHTATLVTKNKVSKMQVVRKQIQPTHDREKKETKLKVKCKKYANSLPRSSALESLFDFSFACLIRAGIRGSFMEERVGTPRLRCTTNPSSASLKSFVSFGGVARLN